MNFKIKKKDEEYLILIVIKKNIIYSQIKRLEDVKKFLKNYKFTNFEDEKKDIISQYPIYIQ